jgi:hypothetical protein
MTILWLSAPTGYGNVTRYICDELADSQSEHSGMRSLCLQFRRGNHRKRVYTRTLDATAHY